MTTRIYRKEKIRQIMNAQYNITEVMEKRQLRWFGYLKRMGSDRIPEMILKWNGERERL